MNNKKEVTIIILLGLIILMLLMAGFKYVHPAPKTSPYHAPVTEDRYVFEGTVNEREVEVVDNLIKEEIVEEVIEELVERVEGEEVIETLIEEEEEPPINEDLQRLQNEKEKGKLRVQAFLNSKKAKEANEEKLLALAEDSEQTEPTTVTVSRSQSEPRISNTDIVGKEFGISAYDLSFQSTGKEIGERWHGITSSGVDLKGLSWDEARVVATDPRVIPTGSVIELEFTTSGYERFNGIYTAEDVGGAIKGERIDFFMGDFGMRDTAQEVWDFGRPKAIVRVLSTPKI